MARTDYGAILSTVIKDTSDAVREVNGTSSLIAPNQWGTAIRTMHSDSDYENALEQMIEETATGDIASFPDGANNIPCPSVLCTINPVQDLHGQDYPYPSGGSKNELPMSISDMKSFNTTGTWNGNAYTLNGVTFSVLTDTANNITGIKVNGTATAEANFDISVYSLKAGTSKKINGTSTTPSDTTIAYGFRGYGNVYANQDRTLTRAEGAGDWNNYVYIKVYQGYNAQNLMYYPMIRDASISDGTFAPYSNICPITGHTELNLVHTGKNLFTYSTSFYNGYWAGTAENPIFTGDNSAKTLDEATEWKYVKIPVKSGTQVTISGMIAAGGTFSAFLGSDNVLDVVSVFSSFNNNGTRTVPSGAKYMCLSLFDAKGKHGSFPNAQVEVGSSATTYEPYTGTTTTETFGTTVYGGTLDVVSGVLTLTHGIIVLDGTEVDWVKSSTYSGGYYLSNWVANNSIPQSSDHIQNRVKTASNSTEYGNTLNCCYFDNSLSIRLDESLVPTLNDFRNWLSQNNVTVFYPLKTPTTTQLTPQEVKSLLGSNNIYHDCNGQVAVTYRANGQLYVEQH